MFLSFIFLLSLCASVLTEPKYSKGDQVCKGDENAVYHDCPSSCPPTCEKPDRIGQVCIASCDPKQCVCKRGYILTKNGNKCVKPEECPGGSPKCSEDKVFVNCYVGCPTNFCPTEESRGFIACDPPHPCQPGCACKKGELMISSDDPRCVPASECPEVTCSNPNEVWSTNPSGCYSESCEDIDSDCSDSYSGPPRCVCESGYYRNQSNICVPASECNKECSDDPNSKFSTCPSYCPLTCENPDGKGVSCIASCAPSGCVCKTGFVLDNTGKCVKPSECSSTSDSN